MMRRSTIGKIGLLAILLFLCIGKYAGCFSIGSKPDHRIENVKRNIHVFMNALQEENIAKAASVSTEKALASAMNIPVLHIDSYTIVNIEADNRTAQVSTIINESVDTEIYLQNKNSEWVVSSTISR